MRRFPWISEDRTDRPAIKQDGKDRSHRRSSAQGKGQMRLYQLLIATTALSTGLATASLGATIPVGSSAGSAVYYPSDLDPADGCSCGESVQVGGSPGAVGTWIMSAAQTFSIGGAP